MFCNVSATLQRWCCNLLCCMGINISRAFFRLQNRLSLFLSLHKRHYVFKVSENCLGKDKSRRNKCTHRVRAWQFNSQRKPRPIFTHLTIKSNNRPNTAYLFTYFAIKSRDFGTGKNSISFFFFFSYYASGKIQRRSGDDTVLRWIARIISVTRKYRLKTREDRWFLSSRRRSLPNSMFSITRRVSLEFPR